jgi:hypothetical protein
LTFSAVGGLNRLARVRSFVVTIFFAARAAVLLGSQPVEVTVTIWRLTGSRTTETVKPPRPRAMKVALLPCGSGLL